MLQFIRDVTEQAVARAVARAAKVAPFAAGNDTAVRKSAGPPQAAGDFFQ